MIKEAIEKILQIAQPPMVQIGGLNYGTGTLNLIVPPEAKGFDVTTLDGFVNLLEADVDKFAPAETLIHVRGFAEVALCPRWPTEYGRRKTIITAGLLEGMTKFPYFNQWGPQEEFVIGNTFIILNR